MNLKRTRVVLADDHAMVRESLARVLEDSGDVVVVGQACDGQEVLQVVREHSPECVVLDYSMPDITGLELSRRFKRWPLRVIMLTGTLEQSLGVEWNDDVQ